MMNCGYTPRDTRNGWIFSAWSLAVAIAYVAATYVIVKTALPRSVGIALVALTIVCLGGAVLAFIRFLREADELLRKIQLEALGVAFGAGAVFTLGYRLCERIGAPRLDVSDGYLVMMIFWTLGQYLGYRRYSTPVEA